MARIRQIKPDLFRHETLFALEQHSSLPVRLAFIGLWTVVDRDGRFRWRPREIKLDVMPYDEIDFDAVLNALASKQFIVSYIVDGERYGYIPSWNKHQNPHVKEKGSTVPAPDAPGSSLVSAPDENSFSRAEYGIRNTYKTPLPPLEPELGLTGVKPVPPAITPAQNGHKPDIWAQIIAAVHKSVPTDTYNVDFWMRDHCKVQSWDGARLEIDVKTPDTPDLKAIGKWRVQIREARMRLGVKELEFFYDGRRVELQSKPVPS